MYFWECLWGCFCVRLAFWLVNSLKQITHPYVHGQQLLTSAPESSKKQRRGELTHLFPASLIWHISSSFAHRLEFTPSLPLVLSPLYSEGITLLAFWGSAVYTQQMWILGLLSFHNCVSRYLIINMNVHGSVCIYSVSLENPY